MAHEGQGRGEEVPKHDDDVGGGARQDAGTELAPQVEVTPDLVCKQSAPRAHFELHRTPKEQQRWKRSTVGYCYSTVCECLSKHGGTPGGGGGWGVNSP